LKNRIYLIACFCICLFLFISCKKAIPVKFAGKAQGTTYSISYYNDNGYSYQTDIDSLLMAFNKTASLYDSSSIITLVNRNMPVRLDNDFKEIFNRSLKISRETGGAFDFTVRALVKAFGFDSDYNYYYYKRKIDSIRVFTGYTKVKMEGDSIVKEDPRTALDFNAIAQGYSVDLVSRLLEEKGVRNYLIEIGGEVFAKGKKEDGTNWIIGIEKPVDHNEKRELIAKVILNNRALATSGSYRKSYNKNGIRISHIIDPRTGYPITHTLLSATVFASNCADADAYATAFMVMGMEKSKEFLMNHKELDGYLIASDSSGSFKTYISDGIKKVIAELP
jgi:FAD:protein FMN transferase